MSGEQDPVKPHFPNGAINGNVMTMKSMPNRLLACFRFKEFESTVWPF